MTDQTFDITAALDVMQEKAEAIGVRGVAVVLILPTGEEVGSLTPQMRVCGRYSRPSDPIRGADDTGTNYLAVAFSKVADMVRTQQASGHSKIVPKGELGFEGGHVVVKDDYTAYVAFSGGTAEQDTQVALAALNALGFLEVYMD